MNNKTTDSLLELTQRLSATIQRYQGKGITEQDTKNALIEPVLEVLGWTKHSLEHVRAEYRADPGHNPVDYALLHQDKPVLLIEAKALDQRLDDHRAVAQLLSYATMAGVDWGLLTNGRRWDLYAVFTRGKAEDRRFWSLDLLDAPRYIPALLSLTREALQTDKLEHQWRAWFAEVQVRSALHEKLQELRAPLLQRFNAQAGLTPEALDDALARARDALPAPASLPWLLQTFDAPPMLSKASQRPAASPALSATPTAARCVGLPEPPPNTKPATFGVGDTQWDIASWRELPQTLLRWLHGQEPTRYEDLFGLAQLQGRKRRYLDRSPDTMHTPLAIPGGFVEANCSARAQVRLARDLLEAMNLPLAESWYVLKTNENND